MTGRLITLLAVTSFGADDMDAVEFFEKRIRPALVEHCFECHSDKSEELGGDLRLDRNLTKVAPLIVVGQLDKSRLIQAIRYTDSDLQMPPSGRLPLSVVADFEAWVQMGPLIRDRGFPIDHQSRLAFLLTLKLVVGFGRFNRFVEIRRRAFMITGFNLQSMRSFCRGCKPQEFDRPS